ncbi:imidazole glycerol phosphate synthase subunit HisH [Legionella spiritensis]|uniref:imidazole glycerol phosphate synthase subunit HisH n=1 Tax=Legionella spiritensis TaxID=452 RepID=UPI000F6BF280|nr:imidazole glycerol phosphate synthase subunit HisH [Legionella spiritensis]VEG90462.1 glutamine amidotransferase [Legionella spiritensis]
MIAVIDVCGNNLASLGYALKRLGYEYQLTHDKKTIQSASHVILPGVGAAHTGMQALIEHGLVDTLKSLRQPLLGICLGMQLLFEYSEEQQTACLGLLPGTIRRLPVIPRHPLPHMGWNRLIWRRPSPLQRGLTGQEYVYFVHSYALLTDDHALAVCHYSQPFTAIVQSKTVCGMQFHPEKSSDAGLILLNNFLQQERA